MSDLVKRIRQYEASNGSYLNLFDEAAARIEALEAALRLAKEYICDLHALREINAALTPEQNK